MKATLRYLGDTYISNCLGALGVIALAALVGSQVMKISFFATYYYMLPMMQIIFVLIFSVSLTTIYRNMALSMNCLRRHFFWGCQLAFIAVAVCGAAILWLAAVLPELMGIGFVSTNDSIALSGPPVYNQPALLLFLLVVSLFLQPMGAALGGLYSKSKVWATACLVVVSLLGVVGTVLLLFISDGTVTLPPAVPVAFLAVLAAICAGCEGYFWHSNGKTVVR